MKNEKNKVLDIIYSVATGSINGLPAINERKFEQLSDAIINFYNSHQSPNETDNTIIPE